MLESSRSFLHRPRSVLLTSERKAHTCFGDGISIHLHQEPLPSIRACRTNTSMHRDSNMRQILDMQEPTVPPSTTPFRCNSRPECRMVYKAGSLIYGRKRLMT